MNAIAAPVLKTFGIYLYVPKIDHSIRIADGCEFEGGWCAVVFRKLGQQPAVYPNIADVADSLPTQLKLEWD